MNRNFLLLLFFCAARYLLAAETSVPELKFIEETFITISSIKNNQWKDYFVDSATQETVFSTAKYSAMAAANTALYPLFTKKLARQATRDRIHHYRKAHMITKIEEWTKEKIALQIEEELDKMPFKSSNKNEKFPFPLFTDRPSLERFKAKIRQLFDDSFRHFPKDIALAVKLGSHLPENLHLKSFLQQLFSPQEDNFRLAIKGALFLAFNNHLAQSTNPDVN